MKAFAKKFFLITWGVMFLLCIATAEWEKLPPDLSVFGVLFYALFGVAFAGAVIAAVFTCFAAVIYAFAKPGYLRKHPGAPKMYLGDGKIRVRLDWIPLDDD